MLNHIVIMGRLVRDPECRRTGSGTAVTSFTVAVDRDIAPKGQDKETDFIDVVAWRNLGEFVHSYFQKGRMIVVDGRLQIRSWKDKDGRNRKTAEVVADNVYFADSKPEGSNHGCYNNAPAPGGYNPPMAPASYSGKGNSYQGDFTGGYTPGGYGDFSYPASDIPPDCAMLEDDDSQLPF